MIIWARWRLRLEEVLNMDNFAVDGIDGMAPCWLGGVGSRQA